MEEELEVLWSKCLLDCLAHSWTEITMEVAILFFQKHFRVLVCCRHFQIERLLPLALNTAFLSLGELCHLWDLVEDKCPFREYSDQLQLVKDWVYTEWKQELSAGELFIHTFLSSERSWFERTKFNRTWSCEEGPSIYTGLLSSQQKSGVGMGSGRQQGPRNPYWVWPMNIVLNVR